MSIFLIRHAKAGDRERWTRPDQLRPLTKAGRRQAEGLVELLDGEDIKRLRSSVYVRCVETVEPLGAQRGLEIEHDQALAEGAPLRATLDLVEEAAESGAQEAWSTHGDVVENLIGHLEAAGVPGADVHLCKKGSTWVLTVSDGRIAGAKYLLPPT